MRKRFSFLMVAALGLILSAQPLHVRADDGGDGGGGDGGSGDGSGTDSGTGTDGTGNGGADDTGADGPSNGDAAAPTAVDEAPDAQSTDQTNIGLPSVTFAPPTDPTTQNPESPIDAIQDEATADPRGGFSEGSPTDTGVRSIAPPAGVAGKTPVDVAINAVIVSAAQSPWDAIVKAPEVRNVVVTGGIVALGQSPLDGEIPGGGSQPAWLQLIPDFRLLNGSMIPPVVPNVIDIRILSCPIQISYPSGEK